MSLLQCALDAPDRLVALERLELLDSPAEPSFDRLTRLAARFVNAPVCLISLVDDKRQFFKSAEGLSGWAAESRQTDLSHSFCQYVVTSGQPLIVDEAAIHPLLKHNLAVTDLNIQAYLGIPILSPEGFVLGSFCVIDHTPRHWSSREQELMTELTELVATQIRLHDEAKKRRQTEAKLQAVLNSTSYTIVATKPDGIIEIFNAGAEKTLGYKRDELVGRATPSLFHDRTEVAARAKELSSQMGKTVEPGFDALTLPSRNGATDEREWTYIRKNGTRVQMMLSLSAMRDTFGAITGYLGVARDLTARKAAESAREEMAARLGKLGAQVPGMIFQLRQRTDGSFCIPYASEGVRDIYRLVPAYVLEDATPVFDRTHPDDLPGVVASIHKSAEALLPWHHEYRIRYPDGTQRWLLGNSMPERELDGSVLWHGFITDITERKLAQRETTESEERFRTAFEFAGIGMAIVGLDGLFLKVNRTLCEIVGYPESDLLTKTFQDITHPDDLNADLAHVGRLIAGKAHTYQMEKRYVHREGRIVWIRLTGSIVRTADGAPLQFVSQIEDITKRKYIEQALSESEERTRLFAEHAPASVAMLDRNLCYLVVSRQWLNDYKLKDQSIIGRSHIEVLRDFPSYWRTVYQRSLAGAVETNEAERITRLDGSVQWLRWEIRPWYKGKGEIGGIVIFTQDITHGKELEEKLAKARDAALDASRLKSEFLATMSHEIRTPMNGVIGMSTMLLDSLVEHKQRAMAEVIVHSAENLLTIINDILDFSKIESGKFRIDPIDFNLRDAIEETVALLAAQAFRKNLNLICDIEPALTTGVKGDCGRIQQVLTNLLGNALKFTENGEVRVKAVALKTIGSKLTFRIEVSDTGIGISESAKAHLFQPFIQADGSTTRRFGGTGLGLAISGQLLSLMGGTVGYESTEKVGSCFWFELTLTRVDLPLSEISRPIPKDTRALIIEPHEINQSILLRQFAALKIEADAISATESALLALRETALLGEPYSIVVFDWNTSSKDGLKLAEAIRADPVLASVHLIVLTSSHPAPTPEVISALKFETVLMKPVREVQLRRSVMRLFDQDGTPKTLASSEAKLVNRRLKLLVAEDNEINQLVTRLMVEKMGHSVEIANNGREALERLTRLPYDAILMDCQMPEIDGYEATRRIRAGEAGSDRRSIPIIALTAYAMAGDHAKATLAGMNDYVSKPLVEEALVAAFSRCGLLGSLPKTSKTVEPIPIALPSPKPTVRGFFDVERRAQLAKIKLPDGTSLWEKAFNLFMKEMPSRMTSLAASAASQDTEQLVIIGHTIGGSAANLGATSLQSAGLALERVARARDWKEVSVKVSAVESAWIHLQTTVAADQDRV